MSAAGGRGRSPASSQIIAKLDMMTLALTQLQQRLELVEFRVADCQAAALKQLGRQVIPLDEQYMAIRTPTGWSVIGCEETTSIVHLADGGNIHEQGTAAALKRLVAPGDTVVDVGAHVGLHTIPLAMHVGVAGRVHAFEPIARSAEALRRALLLNGLSRRCRIHLTAVGGRTGHALFYEGSNSMMGSLFADAPESMVSEVPITTLDDALEPGTRVALVKIDAEGAEAAIAAGMSRLAGENPELVVVAELGMPHLRKIGITAQGWLESFATIGLSEAWQIDDLTACIWPFDPRAAETLYSANLLLVRPDNIRVRQVLQDYGTEHTGPERV